MTFLEVGVFVFITCLLVAGCALIAHELHGTAKDIAAAITDKPPVTINIDAGGVRSEPPQIIHFGPGEHTVPRGTSVEALAELAQLRNERDSNRALRERLGVLETDVSNAENVLASKTAEVERLKLELANLRDTPPLTSLKLRRNDYLASSVRGLLLHAGLVRTGGEAHARAARGEVKINAYVISDVESNPTLFVDALGTLMFDLHCGGAFCAVTVIP
jgi:hypothetical protein